MIGSGALTKWKYGEFQLGKEVPRKKMKPEVERPPVIKAPPDEEPVGLIQGRTPHSVQEWYVSQALKQLKFNYVYQYSIANGENVAGGYLIDFLVYTDPQPTPLEVHASYWDTLHRRADDFRWNRINKWFGGQINEPIILDADLINSTREAVQMLRKDFRK